MTPITLLAIKGIALKYWREAGIIILALLLAGALFSHRETKSELITLKADLAISEQLEIKNETTVRDQSTRLETARVQLSQLSERLSRAERTTRTSEPVMLANGTVAYRLLEETQMNLESASEEKGFLELRYAREVEAHEQTALTAEAWRRTIAEQREEIRKLETSRPATKHWLASLQTDMNGAAAGTWWGGVGAMMNLGGLNGGLLVQVPVAGGPTGGPADKPMGERPVLGGFVANF